MFLTSPYIDQALSQACAFTSPFSASMSVVAMLRQLRRLLATVVNARAHGLLRRE